MMRHILKVLKGEFDVPVSDRTKAQRSTLVRVRRNNDWYSLSDDREVVWCDGKRKKRSDFLELEKIPVQANVINRLKEVLRVE